MEVKRDLQQNKVEHVVRACFEADEIRKFFEEKTGTKIEGKIETISAYFYNSTRELEITIKSVKEDRLRELTYNGEE